MGVKWCCDLCGTPGVIHPRTEPITQKETVTLEVPNPKDPKKKITKKVVRDIPVTEIIRRQNTQTSRVETLEIQKMKDLEPRAIIVILNFGMENVQKDFCMKCYNREVKQHVEPLFDFLHKIQDR